MKSGAPPEIYVRVQQVLMIQYGDEKEHTVDEMIETARNIGAICPDGKIHYTFLGQPIVRSLPEGEFRAKFGNWAEA